MQSVRLAPAFSLFPVTFAVSDSFRCQVAKPAGHRSRACAVPAGRVYGARARLQSCGSRAAPVTERTVRGGQPAGYRSAAALSRPLARRSLLRPAAGRLCPPSAIRSTSGALWGFRPPPALPRPPALPILSEGKGAEVDSGPGQGPSTTPAPPRPFPASAGVRCSLETRGRGPAGSAEFPLPPGGARPRALLRSCKTVLPSNLSVSPPAGSTSPARRSRVPERRSAALAR